MESSSLDFLLLPHPVRREILRMLTPKDRRNLSRTNRYLHHFISTTEDPTIDGRPCFEALYISEVALVIVEREARVLRRFLKFECKECTVEWLEDHGAQAHFDRINFRATPDFADHLERFKNIWKKKNLEVTHYGIDDELSKKVVNALFTVPQLTTIIPTGPGYGPAFDSQWQAFLTTMSKDLPNITIRKVKSRNLSERLLKIVKTISDDHIFIDVVYPHRP